MPSSNRTPAVADALRSSAAHVFVDDVHAPELRSDDRHHLERVLRLRAGEDVTVADGAGSWRRCAFTGGPAGRGGLEPVSDVATEPAPSPLVTIGFALVKGDRPEWTVQKLVELGVDVVVPFAAARSVVRWDGDKAARNAERLTRVAVEAAMQSRRVWLPVVRPVAPLAEAIARCSTGAAQGGAGIGVAGAGGARGPGADGAAGDSAAGGATGAPRADGVAGAPGAAEAILPGVALAGSHAGNAPSAIRPGGLPIGPVALAEPGGPPLSLDVPAVFVGPEGGWAPEELATGLPTVGLGPAVLRTETAAVTAGVLLCALRARLVQNHNE